MDIIISGRTVHDSTYKDAETIRVEEGGLLRRATLKPATLYVYSGGVVGDRVVVRTGGIMHVSSGGLVSGSTESDDPAKPLDNYVRIGSAGTLYVADGGVVSNCLVDSNSVAHLSSGGLARDTVVESGVMHVSKGGVADGGSVDSMGEVNVKNGGLVSNFVVNGKLLFFGTLNVSSGGVARDTVVSGSFPAAGMMNVLVGGFASGTVLEGGGRLIVSSGGVASDTTANYGDFEISGGFAERTEVNGGMVTLYGGVARETTVMGEGIIYLSGGVAHDNYVMGGGRMNIAKNGVASSSFVGAAGSMHISSGGEHRGSLYVSPDASVTVADGGVIDFDATGCVVNGSPVISDISLINCAKPATAFAVTVPWFTTGDYYLAQGQLSDSLTVTVKTPDGVAHNSLVEGGILYLDRAAYELEYDGFSYVLTVTPDWGSSSAYGVSFSAAGGVIAYTKGDGKYLTVALDESNSIINTYGLTGSYHWERYGEGELLSGDVSGKKVTSPQYFQAYANLNPDLFFANAKGVWEGGYTAKHVGSNDWEGTGESVNLSGKNKIVDVFVGAGMVAGQQPAGGDFNVLALTDDANGDALFLDDIYSAIPTAVQQARLSDIMEIRAGAGDDIVDLTSQRFDFASQYGGVSVYGGDGNDTIWANGVGNLLFGDAGNDRIVGGGGDDFIIGGAGNDTMHGGGGSDTFCFGGNWGNDVVEQLADGEVTLWFKTGSSNNWDATAMKYTDGLLSVTVRGVIADNVTLMFGDGTSSAPDGAFLDAASARVFEDPTKGYLA